MAANSKDSKSYGLVLTRLIGEQIILKKGATLTQDIVITMVRSTTNGARIAIKAQTDVEIVRAEIDK